MEKIKRIIIPVDDTEDSKNAVKNGAFFAKLLGVDVKIITVNDTHQFISSVILELEINNSPELNMSLFDNFLILFNPLNKTFG